MNYISSSDVNKATIDQIVHEMVKTHGFRWIPDWIERKLYTNVIYMIMRLFDSVFANTKLVIFDHDVKIDIVPPQIPKREPI
jgi:hypothetical protein